MSLNGRRHGRAPGGGGSSFKERKESRERERRRREEEGAGDGEALAWLLVLDGAAAGVDGGRREAVGEAGEEARRWGARAERAGAGPRSVRCGPGAGMAGRGGAGGCGGAGGRVAPCGLLREAARRRLANGALPSGASEVEGAGKQGGGGWIWLVARFSRGMRRLRVGEG